MLHLLQMGLSKVITTLLLEIQNPRQLPLLELSSLLFQEVPHLPTLYLPLRALPACVPPSSFPSANGALPHNPHTFLQPTLYLFPLPPLITLSCFGCFLIPLASSSSPDSPWNLPSLTVESTLFSPSSRSNPPLSRQGATLANLDSFPSYDLVICTDGCSFSLWQRRFWGPCQLLTEATRSFSADPVCSSFSAEA